MLTNYVMFIWLVDKSANTVVSAYLKESCCRFGGSQNISFDNGSEFKNSLFLEVASQLGIKHIYSFLYRL